MIGTIASVVHRSTALRLAAIFWAACCASALALGAALALTGASTLGRVDRVLLAGLLTGGALAALAADRGWLRIPLPYLRRQVASADWSRSHARAAASWGVQLGLGAATFVPTSALYLVLAGSLVLPLPFAVLPMAAFGLARGAQPFVAALLGTERLDPSPGLALVHAVLVGVAFLGVHQVLWGTA